MSDYRLTKDHYIVINLEKTSTMAEACSCSEGERDEPEPEFTYTACLFKSAYDGDYEGHVVRTDDDEVLSGISAYDAETLLKLMRQWLEP